MKGIFFAKCLDGVLFISIFVPFPKLRLKSRCQSNFTNQKIVATYALL